MRQEFAALSPLAADVAAVIPRIVEKSEFHRRPESAFRATRDTLENDRCLWIQMGAIIYSADNLGTTLTAPKAFRQVARFRKLGTRAFSDVLKDSVHAATRSCSGKRVI